MAQDIPQLLVDARALLTTLPYQATERLTLTAVVDQLETMHSALKPFAAVGMHAIATACPDDRLVDAPPARAAVWRAAAAAFQGEA